MWLGLELALVLDTDRSQKKCQRLVGHAVAGLHRQCQQSTARWKSGALHRCTCVHVAERLNHVAAAVCDCRYIVTRRLGEGKPRTKCRKSVGLA